MKDDKTTLINSSWAIEDILLIAEEKGIPITGQEAVYILRSDELEHLSDVVSEYGMSILREEVSDMLLRKKTP